MKHIKVSYIKSFDNSKIIELEVRKDIGNLSQKEFINKYLGTGLSVRKEGSWGTKHWEIVLEKGNYNKVARITADTEDNALEQYWRQEHKKYFDRTYSSSIGPYIKGNFTSKKKAKIIQYRKS